MVTTLQEQRSIIHLRAQFVFMEFGILGVIGLGLLTDIVFVFYN